MGVGKRTGSCQESYQRQYAKRNAVAGMYKVEFKTPNGPVVTKYVMAANRKQAWRAVKSEMWPGVEHPEVESYSVQKERER